MVRVGGTTRTGVLPLEHCQKCVGEVLVTSYEYSGTQVRYCGTADKNNLISENMLNSFEDSDVNF
jgi:hypothetical protein